MSGPEVPIIIQRAAAEQLDQVAMLFDMYRQFYTRMPDRVLARSFIAERIENDESVIFLALRAAIPAGFVQLFPHSLRSEPAKPGF